MIQEPCQRLIEGGKNVGNFYVEGYHHWSTWSTIKEEMCHTKSGFQVNLQERECANCGLLQQRRVHV